MTPTERKLRAKKAALIMHAMHDPLDTTRAARQAFFDSFLARVPADLPQAERLRRAELLRRAHYVDMALKSHRARGSRTGEVR